MSSKQDKSGGAGWWLVVGLVLVAWLGLRDKPSKPTAELAPVAVAPRAEAAPRQPTLAEYLAAIPPAQKLARARDFASLGLQRPAERPEAYTLALRLLEDFPKAHEGAKEAATLRRELVARQALPAADKRIPADSEQLAYLTKLARALEAAKPVPLAAAPTAPAPAVVAPLRAAGTPPSPQLERAPKPIVQRGPACAENGSCFGETSGITGRPKTTHVNGYYRKDGTYVRGHYRSR